MGMRVLLASIGFVILMELVVVPSVKKLLAESRWSFLTFLGAVMFLVAYSNFIYRINCSWLTWCNVCRAVKEMTKFVSPWLLYRVVWIPLTRMIFKSLVVDHHFSTCQASAKLTNFNLAFGSVVLLFSLLYNGQLCWITDMLICWWQGVCCPKCRRAPGRCACPRVILVDVIQQQGTGRVLPRIIVIPRDPTYTIETFRYRE